MLPCIYKWVKGYEGLYIVNNYGSVVSFCRKNPRMLKQCRDLDGYLQVGLCKKGLPSIKKKVHALVGNAFVGERIGGLTFDHIDRIRTNNRADNLRLATKQEQCVNKGIRKDNKSGEQYITKSTMKGLEYYRLQIERNGKVVVNRRFRTNKYTLADVVAERDKELLKLDG